MAIVTTATATVSTAGWYALPEYFSQLHDPIRDRRATGDILIGLFTTLASPAFAAAPRLVRDAVIVGCERGVLNKTVALVTGRRDVASWMLSGFVSAYRLERHLLCDRLTKMAASGSLEPMLSAETLPWAGLLFEPIYRVVPHEFAGVVNRTQRRIGAKVQVSYLKGYVCKKCGAEKIKDESIQKRSADESSTHNFRCDGCNMKFYT